MLRKSIFCSRICTLGLLSVVFVTQAYAFLPHKYTINSMTSVSRFVHSFSNRLYHQSTALFQAANDNSDDLRYLKSEFSRLATNNFISLDTFVNGEEIQALISDGQCTRDEIKQIWQKVIGDYSAADFQKFVDVNRKVDELFEIEEEVEVEGSQIEASSQYEMDENGVLTANYVEESIWDPDFKPATVFEQEFLGQMREFFKRSSHDGLLSYDAFSQWSEIVEILAQGDIDKTCLLEVWDEALAESTTLPEDNEEGLVDYDTFLRINIRLDEVLEEIGEAVDNLTDEEKRQYYRDEFEILSKGSRLLGLEDFMGWQDIVSIIDDGHVPREDIEVMWDALPKELLNEKKGFGAPPVAIPTSVSRKPYGITSENFEAFNEALDNKLQMLLDSEEEV